MQGRRRRRKTILAGVLVFAMGILAVSVERQQRIAASEPGMGSARLVSIEQLPDFCSVQPVSAIATLSEEFEGRFAALGERSVYAAATVDVSRPPVRAIYDTYPIYSSVAVDPVRDEIVLQDTNLFGIKIFNRLDNTPPNVEATPPKRVIEGRDTKNEYNNGLYVDPKSGDIYNVAMDTADAVFVFRGGASGNTEPQRILKVPHRGFQLAVDEEKQELYSTNQYPPRVLVF